MTDSPPPRLRLGMVGGGRGAFIGEAHRIAARLDDRYELVAGALSADPQRAIESGRDLRLDPMRCYTDYRDMAQAEATTREDGIDIVSVVTPNVSHHAICKKFLEAGIDVICDKPLTTTLAEAQDLLATVRRTGRLLGVTYSYTGYPMVREARALIEAGELGAVRIVQVEFALGWLSGPREADSKQAAWRTDPAQSGASFIVSDLGTHCFHLSEFVTGRRAVALVADLQIMVPGRRLEDNAHLLLRYDNGARGAMWVSAVAAGEQVGLRLRVYGEKGHIAWEQSDPDKLRFSLQSEASRTLMRGQDGLSSAAKRATRIVAGLPEGYFEAFGTLYRDYADILAARQSGAAPDPLALWAPMVEEGARGIAFVEAALRSRAGAAAGSTSNRRFESRWS
jgi:predicted dehydrogenase